MSFTPLRWGNWTAAGERLLRSELYRGTELVRVDDPELDATIWVKLELFLPSGSTKDRFAAHVLGHAVSTGALEPDHLVVEASSGSTSIALAMLCASLGVRFRAVMPRGVSRERVMLIRRYGGEVEITPGLEGLHGALRRVDELAAEGGTFTPRQFENRRNLESHRLGTGPELIAQVPRPIDGFVAGLGTGGTLMGTAHALRDAGSTARIARAVPTTGALCGADPEISSSIPGIIDGFSRLYRPEDVLLDGEIVIGDQETVTTARSLCARGFPVGPSSGLNYAAARRLARELGPGAHVATVFCDRVERYFSTVLFDDLADGDGADRRGG
jgi:cysteine synthase A